MTDFNVRDTETLPLIIESIARRVVAVERRSPQFTEAVSVVEVQDLDSRPDPEGPDSYCYVVLTADWYETSANGFLPPPNPPIPVYQWVTSTGPPVVPPTPTPLPDPLLISDGTAAAPSLAFTADTDTGMYRAGTNEIGFTAGGVELLSVGSADVDVMTGHLNVISNTGSPTISLGEWAAGSNWSAVETESAYLILGNGTGVNANAYLRTKGTGALNLGTNGSDDLTIANGGAITTVGNLTVGGNLDLTGGVISNVNEIYADVGSAGDPSYTFDGNTTTGMYAYGTNELGFTVGAKQAGRWTTNGLTLYGANTSTAGKLYFRGSDGGSDTTDLMIDLYGGAYGFGVNGSTLRYSADTYHKFYVTSGAPTIQLGEWTSGGNHAAIQSSSMYILMGQGSANNATYIRNVGTGSLNLGTNNGNDLTIANGGGVTTSTTLSANGNLFANSEFYAAKWIRSTGGNQGWYNQTYGVGLYSTQTLWIRTYGGGCGLITNSTVLLSAPSNRTTTSGSLQLRRETTYGTIVTYSSSRGLKENVQTIGPAESGRIIDKLRPVTYIEKYRSEPDGGFVEGVADNSAETADELKLREWDIEYGFIAEELDALEPDGIRLASYDWQKVDDQGLPKPNGWKESDVTAILVAEVKELRKRLAVLEQLQ